MIRFDEAEHKYYAEDGREIPSVSEIIRFAHREVYESTDKALMDQAADRGTRVHKATQELDQTGTTECDSDIEGYVAAYVKFRQEHDVKWDKIEYIVHGSNLFGSFAGTLDRAGTVDGKLSIVEFKTTSRISSKHKLLYGLQLTGYRIGLMCEPEPDVVPTHLIVLQLKKDGNYNLIEVNREENTFVACQQLHNAFESVKRRRKKNG